MAREGWGEFEVEFFHGRGSLDGIEVGVEGAEKDVG